MKALEKNIKRTILDMRSKGTTGASIDCLRQNTSTAGVVLEVTPGASLVDAYRRLFATTAERVAADMGFEICTDCWAAIQSN